MYFKIPNPDFYVRIKLFRDTGKMSLKVYSFGDKE